MQQLLNSIDKWINDLKDHICDSEVDDYKETVAKIYAARYIREMIKDIIYKENKEMME